ncbi:hypothetical protein PKB_5732 [Pseudomonas knackmussii B13]|uniref:Uncharacterized protein n=1 Tax=Pseudomonas knackmussii (strain DSM 6978 / CCUG 54928 / LMG 23759 / B13) TaxID=1301098 RepID=A0A024HQU8_PSEKB|nr:hypothetical protein PKB_5732 [Pseudomonas knackmussii B13]
MNACNTPRREPVGASLLANGLAQALGLFASKLAPTKSIRALEALS